jgi:hypothetical protein
MTRTSRRVALGLSILLLPALLTVPPLLAKDDAGQDLAPAEAPADDYTRSDGSEANQAQVLQQQAGVAARIETARAETANEWLNGGPEGEVLGRIGLTTSTGADTTTAEVEPPVRVPLAFNPPAAGTPNPDLTATAAPATPPTGGDQALVPFAAPTEVTGQDTATGPAAWTAQAGTPGIEPTRPAADDTPGSEVQPDLADEDTPGRTPAEQAQWEAEEAQIEAARWSLSIPTKEEMAANRALLVKHGRMAPEQAAALNKVDAGDVLPTDGLLDALLPPEVARELRPPPYVPPTQGPETDEQFLRRLRSNA